MTMNDWSTRANERIAFGSPNHPRFTAYDPIRMAPHPHGAARKIMGANGEIGSAIACRIWLFLLSLHTENMPTQSLCNDIEYEIPT